jgi:hypothetical protein
MARQKYRKASEIGEFVYCHRAWWLHHIQGHDPANRAALEAGQVHHAAHGATVQRAAWVRRVAITLFIVAVLLMVFTLYMSMGY